MSIAYEAASLVVDISPACASAERAMRRDAELRQPAVVLRELPSGVHAIGDILPQVLAQLGMRMA